MKNLGSYLKLTAVLGLAVFLVYESSERTSAEIKSNNEIVASANE